MRWDDCDWIALVSVISTSKLATIIAYKKSLNHVLLSSTQRFPQVLFTHHHRVYITGKEFWVRLRMMQFLYKLKLAEKGNRVSLRFAQRCVCSPLLLVEQELEGQCNENGDPTPSAPILTSVCLSWIETWMSEWMNERVYMDKLLYFLSCRMLCLLLTEDDKNACEPFKTLNATDSQIANDVWKWVKTVISTSIPKSMYKTFE